MAWIEVHQTLPRHRKTLATAGRLSVDRWTVVGHLVELWTWGLDNVPPDGFMGFISDQEIAIAAEWHGDASQFVEALIYGGFIDENTDGRWIHDWYEYAGKLLDKREKEKERSKIRRSTNKKPMVDRRSTEVQIQDKPMVDREKLLGTVPNRTVPKEDIDIPRAQASEIVTYIAQVYNENHFKPAMNMVVVDEIEQMAKEYPENWIRDAIQETLRRNATSLRYTDTILQGYKRQGFSPSEQEVKDYAKPQPNSTRSSSQVSSVGRPTTPRIDDAIPDWKPPDNDV